MSAKVQKDLSIHDILIMLDDGVKRLPQRVAAERERHKITTEKDIVVPFPSLKRDLRVSHQIALHYAKA